MHIFFSRVDEALIKQKRMNLDNILLLKNTDNLESDII